MQQCDAESLRLFICECELNAVLEPVCIGRVVSIGERLFVSIRHGVVVCVDIDDTERVADAKRLSHVISDGCCECER